MDASVDIIDCYALPLVILRLPLLAAWRAWQFVRQVGWAVPTNSRRDLRSTIQLVGDPILKNA